MRIFVTGASGWIGSAAVPEMLDAGHEVVGLARSEASAVRIEEIGATVAWGDVDDTASLAKAADDSDGVVHLAFQHEVAFGGDFAAAANADRRAVEAMAAALAGSDRPFVLAGGATVRDFALHVHKELAERLKYARIWGHARFDGQQVDRHHVLADKDVVELHA